MQKELWKSAYPSDSDGLKYIVSGFETDQLDSNSFEYLVRKKQIYFFFWAPREIQTGQVEWNIFLGYFWNIVIVIFMQNLIA